MRHYETIYIVNPSLVEENYKEVLAKFNDLIERQKGVVVDVQEWGTQRMAYNVRKFDKGTYVLVEYCGDSGLTAEFERDLKLDDRILLFQTVKLADQVDPQELLRKKEERTEKEMPEPEAESVEEETAAAEETASQEIEPKVSEEVQNGVQ